MYFGVVPVFLLFLPYRFITGMSLTTYHATQIFAALFICGVFSLFYMLGKAFFKRLSLGLYLSLSAAFSFISVWYAVSAPALYCTAITAAICLEIWSFFFFIRAVFVCEKESTSIRYAFFGSLTGALAFGCRPPIALANLFVLPLIAVFLRAESLRSDLENSCSSPLPPISWWALFSCCTTMPVLTIRLNLDRLTSSLSRTRVSTAASFPDFSR